ncbi:MAG: PIN domain-containing protein [Acidimicrobiales bacterium]|jgi:hypothetical protein
MFYLETSAAVKLVVAERESEAVTSWVADHEAELVSSDLLRTELMRVVKLGAPAHIHRARHVIDSVDMMKLSTNIFERAGEIGPESLRSLDALHLAAALELGDYLDGVVTYDVRLADAVATHGVEVVAPTPLS